MKLIALFTCMQVVLANPATDETSHTPHTNPFPELISTQEIESYFANSTTKIMTSGYGVVRDGKLIKLSNTNFIIHPGDEFRVAFVMNKTTNGNRSWKVTQRVLPYGFTFNQDNQLVPGENVMLSDGRNVFLYPDVYINGEYSEKYSNGGIWKSQGADSPNLAANDPFVLISTDDYTYFEYRYTIPNIPFFQLSGSSSYETSISTAGGNGVTTSSLGTALLRIKGWQFASASFERVDDFAYRKLKNLSLAPGKTTQEELALPERSKDQPTNVSTAFYPLTLSAISNKTVCVNAPVEFSYPFHFPFFRSEDTPTKEAPSDNDSLNYWLFMLKDTDGLDPFLNKDNAVLRPSFSEVINEEVPGYVYVANDIDQPTVAPAIGRWDTTNLPGTNDNSRIGISFPRTDATPAGNAYSNTKPLLGRDIQGEYLTHKYYYLTYRPIPTPLSIQKVDDSNKGLAGAQFKLVAVNEDGTEDLITENLTSDAAGTVSKLSALTLDDTKVFVTQNNPIDPGLHAYKDQDGALLLNPGTYKLIETKAPAGYSKAQDQTFTVELQAADKLKPITLVVTNTKSTVDAGTQTDPTPSGDSSTQTDNPSTGETGTQTDVPSTTDNSSQTEHPANQTTGTQTDNPGSTETGTQTNEKHTSDNTTQTEPPHDAGTQTENPTSDHSTQTEDSQSSKLETPSKHQTSKGVVSTGDPTTLTSAIVALIAGGFLTVSHIKRKE